MNVFFTIEVSRLCGRDFILMVQGMNFLEVAKQQSFQLCLVTHSTLILPIFPD